MDPETGMWRETPHFGHLQHENVVPLRLSKWVFLTSEDDFRAGQASYLYAYIASDFNRALRGMEGSLYVWKADSTSETGNATAARSESIPGRFVPIEQTHNATSTALKNRANTLGAFKFDRLEDIAVRPDVRG
jgi:secreted PhoX family phosphatase